MSDEYKLLARELLDLADLWKKSRWWQRGSIANVIACKVWYRSGELQSALIYHKAGMKAMKRVLSEDEIKRAVRDAIEDCSTRDWYDISDDGLDNLAMLAAKEIVARFGSEAPALTSAQGTGP